MVGALTCVTCVVACGPTGTGPFVRHFRLSCASTRTKENKRGEAANLLDLGRQTPVSAGLWRGLEGEYTGIYKRLQA